MISSGHVLYSYRINRHLIRATRVFNIAKMRYRFIKVVFVDFYVCKLEVVLYNEKVRWE